MHIAHKGIKIQEEEKFNQRTDISSFIALT